MWGTAATKGSWLKRLAGGCFFALILTGLTATRAAAVPAFAVQTGQPCSGCHVGGFGHLLAMMQGGALSHEDTVDNMRLFAREVMPRLQELPLPVVDGKLLAAVD